MLEFGQATNISDCIGKNRTYLAVLSTGN